MRPWARVGDRFDHTKGVKAQHPLDDVLLLSACDTQDPNIYSVDISLLPAARSAASECIAKTKPAGPSASAAPPQPLEMMAAASVGATAILHGVSAPTCAASASPDDGHASIACRLPVGPQDNPTNAAFKAALRCHMGAGRRVHRGELTSRTRFQQAILRAGLASSLAVLPTCTLGCSWRQLPWVPGVYGCEDVFPQAASSWQAFYDGDRTVYLCCMIPLNSPSWDADWRRLPFPFCAGAPAEVVAIQMRHSAMEWASTEQMLEGMQVMLVCDVASPTQLALRRLGSACKKHGITLFDHFGTALHVAPSEEPIRRISPMRQGARSLACTALSSKALGRRSFRPPRQRLRMQPQQRRQQLGMRLVQSPQAPAWQRLKVAMM